ncbi:MAG: 50S ribosomal protein L5 [Bacteroidota bacterium]|nr:50S ribosomal protein L5 [Bacteroidota bacterium]|tara:strand:- start:11998 stop:12549 length:552 start_codon:yes stop_codon:yes gene_type:complete
MNNARLRKIYIDKIVPVLKEKLHYKSLMQVPKIKKISINQGLGASVNDKKLIQYGIDELSLITGQKAVATKAKTSISNFKLREGMPIGVKVTLRGNIMYEFLDRLISVALPRVRDFRGLNDRGFDGNGNYTLGVKEQIIFPEISIDKINKVTGMNITIVIDSNSDKDSFELLKAFGMPFISRN